MIEECDLGYEPRPGQRTLHEALDAHRWAVVVAHRRFGKTVAMVNHLIGCAASCLLERPRYAYIAPFHKQAKAVAWDYLKRFTAPIDGVRVSESELWVELPEVDGGAGGCPRIRLYGGDNPDGLRGQYFDGAVLDEVAQMKPELWHEIVRPALVDRNGFAVFIGTPKGVNLFHHLYSTAQKRAGWYCGVFRADETGVVPAGELEAARAEMTDAQFRQEFLCDFGAGGDNVLVAYEAALDATRRAVAPHDVRHAPRVMGVDVARFGGDRSVVCRRQGRVAYPLTKYEGMDLKRLADVVAHEIAAWKPAAVFVDAGGMGAGVADMLRALGHPVVGVQFAERAARAATFANKRAEMWWNMKTWLEEGGVIPQDDALVGELAAPRYHYDNSGRILLEKKDEMRQRGLPSPDCADALALTFARPVAAPALAAEAAEADYDPLNHNLEGY